MTIGTYSDLLTEMGNWLNRADLSAEIPTFIQLFETRMNRRLRAPNQQVTMSQTVITGQNSYPILPPIREVKDVYLPASTRIELTYVTFPQLREYNPQADSGIPVRYTILGTNVVVEPIPNDTSLSTIVMVGYATLPPLNSGNPTNWLLTDHPDAYLFGSLCEAAAYLKDDERLPVWKSAWEEVLGEIMDEANARRIPAGPLASRPAVWE